ncbi:MAG: hypothetical protein J0H64_05790, partial [Actinobacteria bacterium]|nr:hypothetical protein [Actinomycetota bacterium]
IEARVPVLDALDAMPVDKIPQGQALLGELRRSIDYSHDANGSFVDFARQAGNGYCVPGRLADLSATNKSDAWKRKFTKRWNRVIAPGFHVRTFSASNI